MALAALWASSGGDPADLARIRPASDAVPLPSRLDVAGLARAAVGTASLAASRLAGGDREVVLDAERIAAAYTSDRHLRIDGMRPASFAPLSAFFPTADGWVRTHGNYPHHAEALRRALRLGPDATRDDAAAMLSRLSSAQASEAITAEGGLWVRVADEDPARDAALRASPLLTTTRLGDAPRHPLAPVDPRAPLRGLRVLDLTRVIAGPVGTRALALLGADVLRIDPPGIPELEAQHLDTGQGKRTALLDLHRAADRTRFDALLAEADIVALGYRASALDALGLSPAALVERRPGVIVLRHSAWGDADRRGFDSLVQAACGIARIESADGVAPGTLPAQALDHTTGYLIAAAAMLLLERRATQGGSWLVETSLRRVAAELLGMPRTAEPEPADALADATAHLQSFDMGGREIRSVGPAVSYAGAPTAYAAPRPWGEDEPMWLPH